MVYLSHYEFCDLLSRRTYSTILLSSENQDRFSMCVPIGFSFEFKSVLTCVNPDRVMFVGEGCSITLLMIDHVELEESESVLGDVITVVCNGNNNSEEKHRIKFIMR